MYKYIYTCMYIYLNSFLIKMTVEYQWKNKQKIRQKNTPIPVLKLLYKVMVCRHPRFEVLIERQAYRYTVEKSRPDTNTKQ